MGASKSTPDHRGHADAIARGTEGIDVWRYGPAVLA
jgi:hypothetical protein